MNLNKNSKNTEISAAIPALKDGKTRIFSIEDSSTGTSKVAYLVQEAKTGGADAGTALFLGWGTRLVRAQQRIAPELVGNFKVGQIVPLDIATEESFEPAYAGQSPLVNSSTGDAILVNGKNIYSHTTLVAEGTGTYTQIPRTAVAATSKVDAMA
jgi:hypothetical protein